jgi:hypothetical protein
MRLMGRMRGGLYRQVVLRAHAHRLASPHDAEGQVFWSEVDSRRQIAEIERRLYDMIDTAAEGRDVDELTGLLRDFVGDLPAGRALARRAEAQTKRSGNTAHPE